MRGRLGLKVDRETSARLGRIRQHGTAPELAVRGIARVVGLAYRTRNRDLPGSPDLANRTRRWAVFVHGCYWHSHMGCYRATVPKRNRGFWKAKFQTNRERDRKAVADLRRLGYRVVTIWECELEKPALIRRRMERLVTGS